MDTKNEQTSHRDVIEFYDNIYYGTSGSPQFIPPHYKKLADKLTISKDQRVLDIACGKGEWLSAVASNGARPAGIDISINALKISKKLMPDELFLCSPAESLPLKSGQYDIVSCLGALEHFLDPELALNEMVRVSKTHANLLLLVPNADFLTARLGLYSGTHQTDIKEESRPIAEWEQMFAEAGLTIEDKWRDLHVLSWGWIKSGKWYAVPFRAVQALLLAIWPLKWQYQVYFLCRKSS